MSIALLTGGHLEVELDNSGNMDRAKKWIMKYHWSEDTLFFQNLPGLITTTGVFNSNSPDICPE